MNTENKSTNDTEIEHPRRRRRGSKGQRPETNRKERHGPRGTGRGNGRSPKGRASRGGRRRPLAHGDLRLLILNIVETTPSHGYGLITDIKNLTSGLYEPSPGVIYPALEALQDLGWVEVRPENSKRVLHITKAGKAELVAQSEALTLIEQRLKQLSSDEQNVEPDDVRGAMRQLRHTTVSMVKGKPSDAEIRKAVVTILQDARTKIAGLT